MPEYENLPVWVDENGDVYAADTNEWIGTADEFDLYDSDEYEEDLSPEDLSALYSMAREDMQEEIANLNTQIADLRERDALAEGYGLAQDELMAAELYDEQAQAHFTEAIQNLADRLGRPVSNSQAERIAQRLPAERTYTDEDVLGAARSVGISDSFSGSSKEAREARAAYIESRWAEQEQADDEYDTALREAGEPTSGSGLAGIIQSLTEED